MNCWSENESWLWQNSHRWLVGCNYVPRSAANQLEIWQPDTFAPEQIREELGWASAIGMNSVRIFLHDIAWRADPEGFVKRVDRVLEIAHQAGIGALIVFFDSVWHPFPRGGAQRPPEPHVHNSAWVQSPGVTILRDEARFDALAEYVHNVVARFAGDSRIHGWDLWNEPDNTNGPSYGPRDLAVEKTALIEKYLPRVFDWARRAKPTQPLTCGLWLGEWVSDASLKPHERIQIECSDVISFHCYGPPEDLEKRIIQLERFNRPLLCTEFMARGTGSTFEGALPILKKHGVGAYCWGLVAGRSQTNYPWDSWQKQYSAEPDVWFHDVFRPDGTAYREAEIKTIRELTPRRD